MSISLKDYGRNQKKRKEYIHQSGLLIAGKDVSKENHDACIFTLEGSYQKGFETLFSFNGSKVLEWSIYILKLLNGTLYRNCV